MYIYSEIKPTARDQIYTCNASRWSGFFLITGRARLKASGETALKKPNVSVCALLNISRGICSNNAPQNWGLKRLMKMEDAWYYILYF